VLSTSYRLHRDGVRRLETGGLRVAEVSPNLALSVSAEVHGRPPVLLEQAVHIGSSRLETKESGLPPVEK